MELFLDDDFDERVETSIETSSLGESWKGRKSELSNVRVSKNFPICRPRVRKRPASSSGTIGRLHNVEYERKQIDLDCQMLENRIKLLRLEEEKVLRKISDTRQKAKKVSKRKPKRPKPREPLAKAVPVSRKLQEKHFFQKELSRAARQRIQEKVSIEKKRKVKELKSQRLRIKSEMAEQKKKVETEAIAKRERIKEERIRAKELKILETEKRKQRVQKQLEEKLAREEKERRVVQKRRQRLEQIEGQYMRRLYARHQKQQTVRINLERAIVASSKLSDPPPTPLPLVSNNS